MKTRIASALLAAVIAANAHAHGGERAESASPVRIEETPFGRAGDPNKVSRTVTVDMSDAMRFSPAEIRVRAGETVRFVAKNSGRLLHEMVLGTAASLAAHSELMRKFPEMEHDEPHMLHVRPGNAGEMVWQFTKPGEFRYGCLIPGHYEAGMAGKVEVTK